ncbi:glycerol-3-phosphate 1-O-acyltransferase PlsY [Aerococcaceae bacterium NML190073]|nr:glycerol-3-phosphate 1-O-acyltransferase PlsY [Aerococcaceae bacterium NML190073]
MIYHILLVIAAYLAGSIPTGVWYSRHKHAVDVRELGSGNSGATNIGRNFGFKAAVFVSAIDVLKGWIPVLIAKALFANEPAVIMAVAIACVIGHAHPLFAHFKGGKIVATSIGVLLGFHFWIGLGMVLVFATLLYVTSTVSLSSMISYTLTALYLLLTQTERIYGIGFLLIALFMIYRHRENIARLLNGTEKRIKFGLRKPE